MKHKVKHVHFVGIGGAGMSGIAEVLLNLGYRGQRLRPRRQRCDPAAAKRWARRVHIGHAVPMSQAPTLS